jgi:Zn-dependent M16 (insulinase) family peptidase
MTIKTGQKLTLFQLFNFLETYPSDNSGQPHALEHMIFQGSKNYPQKVKYNDNLRCKSFLTLCHVFGKIQ